MWDRSQKRRLARKVNKSAVEMKVNSANRPNSMKSTISLEDYRVQYPNSASIPTLGQSGLLAGLLARHDRRMARRAHYRAMWNSVVGVPLSALEWVVGLLRPHHNPAPVRA